VKIEPPHTNPYVNQAGAEIAFARAMGWHDWTPFEETREGMVRGYHVQWNPDPNAGIVVPDEADDDSVWVLVTGRLPTFNVVGWITAGQAKRCGWRIGYDE
jgi:hypothetical protein